MSSSPSIEEKCDEKLPSSSPPSEDKIIVEKAPSPSHEHTTLEEKPAKLLAFDGKPENSDSKSNSRGEKVCTTVSSRSEEVHPSSVKNNDEQKQDECSSDVTADISSEVDGEKVENEGKSVNSITDQESKKSTADSEKCKNEEKQKSTDLMENCEDAKATKNVCQSLEESNKTGVDEDKSKKMSDFNNEDKSTNEISVVDAGASADNQCALDTKLKTHNLLEDDSSNSKNGTEDVTGGDNVSQNKIDKLSKSDGKVCENEIDESIKSDIKVSQNKIPDSITSDDSPLLCGEDNEKVKNVSITSTEIISSADLCNKNDEENVSKNTNDENSKSMVSLSKFDDGLNSMHNDILIPSDQQETSNPEEAESNTSKNAKPITLKAWAKGLVSSTKEPSSIEKCDDSSLLCDEILDKSEEDCIASSHVANVSKDSPPNPEYEKVDGEKPQYVIEDSKACLSSKLAENLSAVKTDDVMQSPSGKELQSTLEKKVDSLNVADHIKVTTSSVEELPECVNTGNESNKDVVPKLASIENDNSGNPGQKQTPREDIQITGNKKELRRNRNRNKNKKEELNVAPDNVCNSRTETATAQIEESVETYVSNSQPSMVNKSDASIQITANKKLATGGSLVVNKTSITPYLENIAVNNTGDSSSQIDQKRNDSPGATSLLCADTVKIKSDGKKKAKTVKRKSVKCETNHVSNSRINRTPLPILPKPPIASTSTFVGNSNTISVPLKVSKGTTTDASTERPHKPLILSQMDVQRIAEMKPTNPQVINPDQLHKNICIIKTLKPGTQGGENDAKPKKVSIDCQVDESELSPVGPYQSVVNELSARKGSAPAATNPNNHIVVTVRGTFANAANHSTAPSVPVKIDNAVNTLANQERISDAVKFFFQGPTNLDKFFAPSTHQPNSAEATEISQNVVPSVKEQCGMQQASFKLDKNRATTSKKKVVTDMKKFTPILPKPPGMLGRGEYSMDSSQKVDGKLLFSY
ncbi:hypothetical protein LSTR_LSTR016366 [Laodelphax striatellus]|uniref:Uncharacterized protein n=1 Tax=Laodelphax striatellus TaxID=195883 RepID=A0A482WUU7_LAOST|nr:hypothetical protein LSTR_LSTR016366 [Laodelphax striatellus]